MSDEIFGNSWAERASVAQRLSRTGTEGFFYAESEGNQDYFRQVIAHHLRANIDKRAIATGDDFEFARYEVFENPQDSWAEMLYLAAASIHIWEELVKPLPSEVGTRAPLEVLTHDEVPLDKRTQSMVDGTCNYTFLNETDLFRLEEFYFNAEYCSKFGDIPYSVIDFQDILAGDADGRFDLVKLNCRHVISTNTKMLGKYMDSLKCGGIIVINEMSGVTKLYDDGLRVHQSLYYDASRYVASREDFITYHIPYQLGLIVARRIA